MAALDGMAALDAWAVRQALAGRGIPRREWEALSATGSMYKATVSLVGRMRPAEALDQVLRDRPDQAEIRARVAAYCPDDPAPPMPPPQLVELRPPSSNGHEPSPLGLAFGHEDGEGATDTPNAIPWPEPLDEAALYGLAGDIVRAIEPHTEADPTALLVQLLVAFGTIVGRSPIFRVEAAEHRANEAAVAVGETSKGRKGTSLDYVLWLLNSVDPEWSGRVQEGLSSGEGLIWAVRDAIIGREPVREKGHITGYQEVENDPGVDDKRLLVVETEFCSVLKVATREGNTLSATIRRAWDKGDLRILNKNSPAKATGAHISIIGHITRPELLRHLEDSEAANGFGNRFLWLAVRRSKCLPEGGDLATVDLSPLVRRLTAAVDFAREAGELRRDEQARGAWRAVYPDLSDGRPGLLGAVTSRAEAHVLRLSMIYALLDCSATIRVEHLIAALAVWDYCLASARWIFGTKIGDATADEVLRALRQSPEGLDRTAISGLFGRHKSSADIGRALATLLSLGAATRQTVETGGRRAEVWHASVVSSLTSLVSQPSHSYAERARRAIADAERTGKCETSETSEVSADVPPGDCVFCLLRPATRIVRGLAICGECSA